MCHRISIKGSVHLSVGPSVPLGQLKMFAFNSFSQPFCSFQLSSLVFSWPLMSNISQFSPNKQSLGVYNTHIWLTATGSHYCLSHFHEYPIRPKDVKTVLNRSIIFVLCFSPIITQRSLTIKK